jgi:hypothetical protein
LNAATPEQRQALDDYVGWEFEPINAALRGTEDPSPETAAAIANLDALFGQYRTPGVVVGVRAMGNRSAALPPPGQAVGQILTGDGIQSVSMTTSTKDVSEVTSADVGRNYRAKPVRLRIVIPPGMPAIVAQGTTNAVVSEREILLPHKTRYAITADEMEGDKRWVTVTALPPT